MESKTILRIVGIGIAFVCAVFFAMRNRSSHSDEVKDVAYILVESMDEFTQNEKLLLTMADRAHTIAFDKAYTQGSRFRKAEIDADLYLDSFFRSMVSQAGNMNRQDLKKSLLALRQDIEESGEDEGEDDGEYEVADASYDSADDPPPVKDIAGAAEQTNDGLTVEAIAELNDEQLESTILSRIQERIDLGQEGLVKAVRSLSAGCRMLYLTMRVDRVVSDDGFSTLYSDQFGPMALDAVRAFELVKANRHATLLRRSIAAYVRQYPDQTLIKRSKSVKKLLADYDDDDLDKLTSSYRKLKTSLPKLRIKYIRANAADFSFPPEG